MAGRLEGDVCPLLLEGFSCLKGRPGPRDGLCERRRRRRRRRGGNADIKKKKKKKKKKIKLKKKKKKIRRLNFPAPRPALPPRPPLRRRQVPPARPRAGGRQSRPGCLEVRGGEWGESLSTCTGSPRAGKEQRCSHCPLGGGEGWELAAPARSPPDGGVPTCPNSAPLSQQNQRGAPFARRISGNGRFASLF